MREENKILVTFTIEDVAYEEGRVMYVAGKEDAKKGDLGTIVLPRPARDVYIDPKLPDPVVFSYSNTEKNIVRLRIALVKIDSDADPMKPSTCTVSVLAPSVDGNWVTRTADVNLVLPNNGGIALRNPHGMIQDGEYLYFIDYESQIIVSVKKSALEAAGDNEEVEVKVTDLSAALAAPDAKGQAIVALNTKAYALYLVSDAEATAHDAGVLLRLSIIGDGTLSVESKINVGLNPQSIIPVTRKETDPSTKIETDVVYLLIPAIGGPQDYEGATNGTDSSISVVPALGDWSTTTYPTGIAPVAVTGDAQSYDIHAVAAAMRDGDSLVFILTQLYQEEATTACWKLYQTTVDQFLALIKTSGAPYTLTEAESHGLDVTDQNIVTAPDIKFPDDIYFWDLLYEQTPREDDEEDRLWLVLGSPFLITKAEAYGSPSKAFENPYVMFSGIGGVNVNSVDLTIETLHQAQREVSLKRGLRAAKLGMSARAAISPTSMSAEEGEAEENK
jgi:hypothetical protein